MTRVQLENRDWSAAVRGLPGSGGDARMLIEIGRGECVEQKRWPKLCLVRNMNCLSYNCWRRGRRSREGRLIRSKEGRGGPQQLGLQ